MNDEERGIIVNKIRNLDPDEEVCKIDLANKKITYNEKIHCHRVIESLIDEEIIRAYYLTILYKKLEYPLEKIELEEEFLIGSKSKKTRVRTDIRVNKNSHAFMLFELKTPTSYEKEEVNDVNTQLFKPAGIIDPRAKGLKWLCYCTVNINDNKEIEEEKKVIDYKRFRTFEEWDKKGRLTFKVIPKKYGEEILQRFVKGGFEAYKKKHKKEPNFIVLNLKSSIPKDKLQKIRKDLHDTLWAGGKKEYNKIFFNLVKVILAKIYDEKETESGEPYKLQVVYKNKDGDIVEDLDKTYDNILSLYKKAIKDPEYLGITDKELQTLKKREGAIDLIEFEEHEIAFILELLQNYELTESDYDFLGEFFESIIREEFKQERGQFFTHKNIVDFILYTIELDKLSLELLEKEKRLPYIIDPSVGSGTFLIQVMKLIKETIKDNKQKLENKSDRIKDFITANFPKSKKMVWAKDYLYATEFSLSLAITTKVNMILHGDGHVHSYLNDALADFSTFDAKMKTKKQSDIYPYPMPINEEFDVIVSNPPFSVSLDPRTKQKLKQIYLYGDKKESENLFIERWYQLLKEKGRLGVVLPESVFDTTDNMYIRLFLFKYFWIKSIVSLAGGKDSPFAPHTATKTCLLFAQKKTTKEVKEWGKLYDKKVSEFRKNKYNIEKLINKKELELNETQEQRKEKIIQLLEVLFKDNFDKNDISLELDELVEKYKKLLKEKKLEEWWVFTETSNYICKNDPVNSNYFIFHVLYVGFKRTKRGERPKPNQLYQIEKVNDKEKIIINTSNPKKVLDIIRKETKWN